MQYDTDAMLTEVRRRLDDPARPPMQLDDTPSTPAEMQDLLCGFRSLSVEHQERLLAILEHVASLPEPRRTRMIEGLYIALSVVIAA